MNEPIKVGDLVMLLAAPEPEHNELAGQIRRVRASSRVYADHWVLDPPAFNMRGVEMSWYSIRLRRIPPLSELETTETKQEIPA